MSKVNNFQSNEEQAREKEIRYLSRLYEYIAGSGSYRFAHGENDLSLQKHGIDVEVARQLRYIWYDNKIIGWPEPKQGSVSPYTNFCLETLSCSIPGKETEGWMHTGRADKLTYSFEQHVPGLPLFLDTYILQDFQALKRWFWQQDLTRYPIHTEREANRTRCVLIPISQVLAVFPDTERYFVFESLVIPVVKREKRREPISKLFADIQIFLRKKHPEIMTNDESA